MAESRLDVFIKLKDQISAGLKKIKKDFAAVNEEADELNEQDTKNVRSEYDRLEKEINDIKTATERTNSQLDTIRNAGLAIAGLGAALAAPFLLGIKATAEFSRQIAEIGTLVDDAVLSNEELRDTVLDLSNEFGTSRGDIAQGLYQAISSGAAAGAEANEVLRVALITARGGVTSVTAAVDGLSTVMNAFGFATSEAEAVADRLFVTVKNGRTTIDELSRFLFQAAPVAAALGVPFEELNAALVTLTKQGVPTRVAFTQIRSAINGLVRDTPELNKIFAEFGGAQAALGELGLAGTLQLLRDEANGNVGTLNKLLGSIEAVGAALGLSGPQLEEFNRQLADQKAASGDAVAAADEVAESFGERLSQSIVRVSNLFEALGNFITPVIGPLVTGVGKLAEGFQNLLKSSGVTRFFTGFVAVTGLLAIAVGGLITVFAVLGRGITFVSGSASILTLKWRQLIPTTNILTASSRALGVAWRFMLGPIGLLITAVAFAVGTMSAFADETERAEDTTDKLIATFNNLSDLKQVEALRDQEQNVKTLTAELARLQKALANEEDDVFVNDEFVETTRNAILAIEDQIEIAKEAVVDFTNTINNISEATIDPSDEGIEKYRDSVLDAEVALIQLREEQEAVRLDAEKPIPEFKRRTIGRGGVVDNRAEVDQAETDQRTAQARQALIDQEIADLEKISGRREEQLAIAVRLNGELSEKERLEAAAAAAQAQRLADAKAELTTQQSLTKAVQARARAASREQQAQGRLSAAKDKVALEGGDIDASEFADRERERVDDQLAVDLQGLNARLAAVTAVGDAKIEDLKARRAEDASKVSEETIAAAELSAALAAEAINSEIAIALLEGEADTLAIGAKLADSFIDGFQTQFSNITTVLQAELIRLKAAFEAETITAQEFAEGIAIANKTAADSFAQIRAKLVDALAVASGPEAEALIALIAAIDSAVLGLTDTLGAFEARVISAIEGSLGDFFEEVINDISSVDEAFTKLLQGIGDKVKRLIAEKLANQLIESLFGDGSALGSLFGSGGGSVPGAAGGGYIERAARGGHVVGAPVVRAARGGAVTRAARNAFRVGRASTYLLKAAQGGSVPPLPGSSRPVLESRSMKRTRIEDEEIERTTPRYRAARGGGILKLQNGGGRVKGPGTSTSDSIPAMLSAGEYVMKAAAVSRYGLQHMEALNRGILERPEKSKRKLSITRPRRTAFAGGGFVGTGPLESQGGAGSNQGIQNAAKADAGRMVLEVNEATLNLSMRDFLEREFGRIMATR